MTVYVDELRPVRRAPMACQMTADSAEELDAFAAGLGMRRAWRMEGMMPAYVLGARLRAEAVARGAREIGRRELARMRREAADELTRPAREAAAAMRMVLVQGRIVGQTQEAIQLQPTRIDREKLGLGRAWWPRAEIDYRVGRRGIVNVEAPRWLVEAKRRECVRAMQDQKGAK